MGLDQTLNWIGEPSKSQIERLKHKNLSEFNYTTGMSYISEEDYHDGRYQYIRKYMIPEEVYLKDLDWMLLKSDCGMPVDAHICGLGPNSIKFGEAVNVGDVKEFHINVYDERYWKPVLSTQYFFLCDEVYEWRNNYSIQELFDTAFPDEWCEYKKKYSAFNCGYYPIVDLLGNMHKADPDFAKKYHEGIDNIFYKGYW
ncbi:MAG: hypothetical protein J6B50_08370 [Lachnospiraceae bacterium]|nr:hypothetical protein [Lachnospiraceae bacterium]